MPRRSARILARATMAAHPSRRTTRRKAKDSVDSLALPEPAVPEPVSDEPVSDEPVSDEPVSDEPVSDEPVSDEPVSDEPVSDEPVSDEPVSDEPVSDEQPAMVGKEVKVEDQKQPFFLLSPPPPHLRIALNQVAATGWEICCLVTDLATHVAGSMYQGLVTLATRENPRPLGGFGDFLARLEAQIAEEDRQAERRAKRRAKRRAAEQAKRAEQAKQAEQADHPSKRACMEFGDDDTEE